MSKPWNQMTDEERAAEKRRDDIKFKAIAAVIFTVIIGVILSITLLIRAKAPCWVFPLKEAPSRCLVVNPR